MRFESLFSKEFFLDMNRHEKFWETKNILYFYVTLFKKTPNLVPTVLMTKMWCGKCYNIFILITNNQCWKSFLKKPRYNRRNSISLNWQKHTKGIHEFVISWYFKFNTYFRFVNASTQLINLNDYKYFLQKPRQRGLCCCAIGDICLQR